MAKTNLGILASQDTIDALKKNGFANVTVAPDAEFKVGDEIVATNNYNTLICIVTEIYVDAVMHMTLELSYEQLNERSFS